MVYHAAYRRIPPHTAAYRWITNNVLTYQVDEDGRGLMPTFRLPRYRYEAGSDLVHH
ncbi:TPA: hypothetical protein RGM98_001449 [Legionella pneumophila]|uniref:hypothetical protein n=1 Tax=Legionella pneumophila TaxID=446 RepID=UPI0013EFC1D7|nr:hypothetical protein [Legionella pneumophila]HDU8260326.1 hypothetical protein [Legionella pneumophila]